MTQHAYKNLSVDEYQELFSNFLVERWSYSSVSTFARNEKAFEMQYIYGVYSRRSPTSIAGDAYHQALDYYFAQKQIGKTIDLVELEQAAFQAINEVGANQWKLQKTTPTVEACVEKATKTVAALLRNFVAEKGIYEDEIAEILEVEKRGLEFVTVNGVDIPLPCSFVIDLVVRTKDGKIAIVDHKSKSSFTPDEEVALNIGVQAITYVLGYESMTDNRVDEVWFVENKYSANMDKSPQLVKQVVEINENTRRLYESMLYEPLKRMLEAVSDPDYIYLLNTADNFVDLAELYDFWARTMICEVDDFNVEESKKELVAKRLKKVRDASIASVSPSVIRKFKADAAAFIKYDLSSTDMTSEEKIQHVLRSHGIIVNVAHTFDGYSSNTYLLEVSAGTKIGSIYGYKLDIANALNVPTVRFSREMVVHEGRSYLAVEHAKKRDKDLLFNPDDLVDQKIPLGKDNFGNVIYWDLNNHSTPHALVCGATGSGKSVLLKSVLEYARLAEVSRIVILDPKYDREFMKYKGAANVTVENEIIAIEQTMKELVAYMNELVKQGREEKTLIIFDEFADAIDQSRSGKELTVYEEMEVGMYANGRPKMARVAVGEEASLAENLKMLAQKGRSCGIRILAGTQRASAKVINGDIKVNFPVQICFRVPKEVDSRVVIDEPGAEGLAGKGDGLIKSPEYNDTVRFQAYYKPQ